MRTQVLTELIGGIWHTTPKHKFDNIIKTGSILPEPDPQFGSRWRPMGDGDHRPYVRTLGGVSLFDFEQFEPETYSEKYPSSSWMTFVPAVDSSAVWIEIDRAKVGGNFISGSDLLARWKTEKAYGHGIMPLIEAAHLGPLPRAFFKRAFLVCKEKREISSLDC